MGILDWLRGGKTGGEERSDEAAVRSELVARLGHMRRDAFVPVTEEAPAVGASHFGGLPSLAPQEAWPRCGSCNAPLSLFLELDAAELPEGAPHAFEGTLQLFCCTSDRACDTWEPFSKSQLVRVLAPSTTPVVAQAPDGHEPFPCRRIVGWNRVDDLPNGEERDALGAAITEAESEVLDDAGYPVAGDKLGGWPYWVQGIEYPPCPDCGEPMGLVFQIDSEVNVPWMWGDVGCAHVTGCARHPGRLAFGWACG